MNAAGSAVPDERFVRGRAIFVMAVFALVVAWLLPERVIVRGDDFGYLESLVASIRGGGIQGSDWLEPFNAVLPWLGKGVWALSGDFWWATFGVTSVAAVAGVGLFRRWFRTRNVADEWVVLAAVLSPVFLNKSVEYTGVVLGLVLTLSALLAWRKGAWIWFFAITLLAVANRQSAVCLLVIPAVAIARSWVRDRRLERRLAALWIGAVAGAGGLFAMAPDNFARALAARKWVERFSLSEVTANVLLGVIVCAAVRVGWQVLRGESLPDRWRRNLERPAIPLALTIAGVWIVLGGAAVLRCETPGLEPANLGLIASATLVGAWLGKRSDWPEPEVGFAVLAYVVLVSFRGDWWDYYFLEPAVMLAAPGVAEKTHQERARWTTAFLLLIGLAYAWPLGKYLERCEAKIMAYETALRSGAIRITEASDAPFGFLGWKLFDAGKGRGMHGARLSDFLKFVEGGRTAWIDGRIVRAPEGERRSIHPTGEKWPLPKTWKGRPFPLTPGEWRQELKPPDNT